MVSLDVGTSPDQDLLMPAVFDEIKGWLLSGHVWGIFFATPCGAFSRARRGNQGGWPAPLRDDVHPRGVPGLVGRDKAKVKEANLLADRAFLLYRVAAERGIVAVEENPATSWLWSLEQRRVFVQKAEVSDVIVYHCAFGTAYRARTRFRFCHVGLLPELSAQRCHGRGTCSFSGERHTHLSGKFGKDFMSAKKAEYPPELSRALAKILSKVHLDRATTQRWALYK